MPESLKAAAFALAQNAEARWAALVAGIFLAVYLVRKFAPKLWLAFETRSPFVVADPEPVLRQLHKAYQAIPSVLLGAVVPALLTGGDWKAAGIGALLGLVPPLQHEFAKWAKWIPYRGELGKATPKDPKDPPAGGSSTKDPEPTRIRFPAPDEPPFGGAAALSRWRLATVGLAAFILGSFISLGGCSPAAVQTQREASTVVAQLANATVKPSLIAAFKASGRVVLLNEPDPALAQYKLGQHVQQWKPVWVAWHLFQEANTAWQEQLESGGGDPLLAAAKAREAYCKLRAAAAPLKVELPDFPGITCGGGS